MTPKARKALVAMVIIILGIYFATKGIVAAQNFFAPLVVASLLAMMFLPVAGRMEKLGIGRGWSSLFSVLIALTFFAGLFVVVSVQMRQIANDWPQIKEQMQPRIEQAQQWIEKKTGIAAFKQEQIVKDNLSGTGNRESGSSGSSPASKPSKEKSSSGNDISELAGRYLIDLLSFLGVALLTSVYLFFMLLYRTKIRKSVLNFFSVEKKPDAGAVLGKTVAISQNYLLGRFILILILAILYSTGLLISGVHHAVLISIIGAFLSLIPYIGNVIAVILSLGMVAFSGGELMAFVGVVITFSIVQFVESYILEPYIVGHQVNINPLLSIIAVVLGGVLWGVIGMIVVIPVFGIIKIVCDHIPVLRPVGYFLGDEDLGTSKGEGYLKSIANRLKRKAAKNKNAR